ncbi:MAG TPA: hypothetical protein DDW65_01175 [Firmicutes bacterium]|jgi:hypothetical protein|nr:hypothetical protein [Bacillota bacterium]
MFEHVPALRFLEIFRFYGIIKMEQNIGSNKYLSETIKLKFERQDDSLFELPSDCKIIQWHGHQ